MNETEHHEWWKLHLRAARGDALSAEEKDAYEVGLTKLHDEEGLAEDLPTLRQARVAVLELDRRCEGLQSRRRQLKEQIEHLESELSEGTRRSLGIED